VSEGRRTDFITALKSDMGNLEADTNRRASWMSRTGVKKPCTTDWGQRGYVRRQTSLGSDALSESEQQKHTHCRESTHHVHHNVRGDG
jgi:hypothetical protein